MKKLMVIAAVALAAVAANAASFNWQVKGAYSSQIKDGSKAWNKVTGAVNPTAYLLLASSKDAALAAINAAAAAGESYTGTGTIGSEVAANLNNYGGMKAAKEISGVSTDTLKYVSLLVYEDTDGAIHYQFSSEMEGKGSTDMVSDPQSITFAGDTFSSTGWTVASVPEPTSGLLLLLGMAGLALRRRRA